MFSFTTGVCGLIVLPCRPPCCNSLYKKKIKAVRDEVHSHGHVLDNMINLYETEGSDCPVYMNTEKVIGLICGFH